LCFIFFFDLTFPFFTRKGSECGRGKKKKKCNIFEEKITKKNSHSPQLLKVFLQHIATPHHLQKKDTKKLIFAHHLDGLLTSLLHLVISKKKKQSSFTQRIPYGCCLQVFCVFFNSKSPFLLYVFIYVYKTGTRRQLKKKNIILKRVL